MVQAALAGAGYWNRIVCLSLAAINAGGWGGVRPREVGPRRRRRVRCVRRGGECDVDGRVELLHCRCELRTCTGDEGELRRCQHLWVGPGLEMDDLCAENDILRLEAGYLVFQVALLSAKAGPTTAMNQRVAYLSSSLTRTVVALGREGAGDGERAVDGAAAGHAGDVAE